MSFTTTYTYDAAGRLTRKKRVDDANPTTVFNQQDFTYDQRNRLTGISNTVGGGMGVADATRAMSYNGLNEMVTLSDDPAAPASALAWHAGKIAYEKNGSRIANYRWGPTGLVEFAPSDPEKIAFPSLDVGGGTRKLTNGLGSGEFFTSVATGQREAAFATATGVAVPDICRVQGINLMESSMRLEGTSSGSELYATNAGAAALVSPSVPCQAASLDAFAIDLPSPGRNPNSPPDPMSPHALHPGFGIDPFGYGDPTYPGQILTGLETDPTNTRPPTLRRPRDGFLTAPKCSCLKTFLHTAGRVWSGLTFDGLAVGPMATDLLGADVGNAPDGRVTSLFRFEWYSPVVGDSRKCTIEQTAEVRLVFWHEAPPMLEAQNWPWHPDIHQAWTYDTRLARGEIHADIQKGNGFIARIDSPGLNNVPPYGGPFTTQWPSGSGSSEIMGLVPFDPDGCSYDAHIRYLVTNETGEVNPACEREIRVRTKARNKATLEGPAVTVLR